MIHSSQSEKGFTLLEAMVALLVLSVGLLGVGGMLRASMSSDRFSIESRNSDWVALEIIEELKGELANKSFDDLKTITLSDPHFNETGRNDDGGGHWFERWGTYVGYRYRWRVDDGQAGNLNMLKLSIRMGWGPCSGTDPLSCKYSAQITNFMIPGR
jgi:prepilin-type N-terminal cleavage/methylation domain-containing protein